MLPGEIKHESLQVTKQALAEDEDYTKETVEETRLRAVQNMQAYQEETKRWRNKKVVRKKNPGRRSSPDKKAKCRYC